MEAPDTSDTLPEEQDIYHTVGYFLHSSVITCWRRRFQLPLPSLPTSCTLSIQQVPSSSLNQGQLSSFPSFLPSTQLVSITLPHHPFSNFYYSEYIPPPIFHIQWQLNAWISAEHMHSCIEGQTSRGWHILAICINGESHYQLKRCIFNVIGTGVWPFVGVQNHLNIGIEKEPHPENVDYHILCDKMLPHTLIWKCFL